MPVLNAQALINNRVEAIQDMHRRAGQQRAELDLSGGVDSAVMLGLLTRALGPENVATVFLGINSNPEALIRAHAAAEAFGARLIAFDGTAVYGGFLNEMLHAMTQVGYSQEEILARIAGDKTILGSIRSTMRAPWGRAVNRLTGGGIRHGTGNEDEDRVLRFYQKGGDGEVDSNPIAMLSKGEVYQLAIALGVPRSILTARPSPDLWGVGDQHNDEDEISSCLGIQGSGLPCYSYVDPDTGAYTSVGLIERLSRFCDYYQEGLFDDSDDIAGALISQAASGNLRPEVQEVFGNLSSDIIRTLLTNARRVEKITRHKMNPNCPSLGSRADLVQAGILTNALG